MLDVKKGELLTLLKKGEGEGQLEGWWYICRRANPTQMGWAPENIFKSQEEWDKMEALELALALPAIGEDTEGDTGMPAQMVVEIADVAPTAYNAPRDSMFARAGPIGVFAPPSVETGEPKSLAEQVAETEAAIKEAMDSKNYLALRALLANAGQETKAVRVGQAFLDKHEEEKKIFEECKQALLTVDIPAMKRLLQVSTSANIENDDITRMRQIAYIMQPKEQFLLKLKYSLLGSQCFCESSLVPLSFPTFAFFPLITGMLKTKMIELLSNL